jgi:hypothetical protein
MGFPNGPTAARKMISARTRTALAAAKARGQKLGGFRGYIPTAEDGANGRKPDTARRMTTPRRWRHHYAARPRRLAVAPGARGEPNRRRLADAWQAPPYGLRRALSQQPFLLLITCLTARLRFNKFNGLGSRQDAAREPLLARRDNAVGGPERVGGYKDGA